MDEEQYLEEINELNSQLEELGNENERLQEEIEELGAEFDELHQEKSNLEDELEQYISDDEKTTEALGALERILKMNEEIYRLSDEIKWTKLPEFY